MNREEQLEFLISILEGQVDDKLQEIEAHRNELESLRLTPEQRAILERTCEGCG